MPELELDIMKRDIQCLEMKYKLPKLIYSVYILLEFIQCYSALDGSASCRFEQNKKKLKPLLNQLYVNWTIITLLLFNH